jgi:1-acyl-sn-glycerol-3-phosphate acyltransferase
VALFDRYVRRLVSRHFAAVHVCAHSRARLPAQPRADSALFVANHTNWWDGFLAWLVSRKLGLDFHILMEAIGLDRYWMFKYIGALPMRRDRATAAYADLTAAAQYLKGPASSLWIFPQGERSPPLQPVSGTEHGAAQIALILDRSVPVIPVAFRYTYLGEQLPEAFIAIGAPVVVPPASGSRRTDRKALALAIERAMQETVDQLDRKIEREARSEFDTLLAGTLSINKRLDRVRHAAGTIDGPFEPRNG